LDRNPEPDCTARLLSVGVLDEAGNLKEYLHHHRPFQLRLRVAVYRPAGRVYVAIHIHDDELSTVLFSRDLEVSGTPLLPDDQTGDFTITAVVPAPLLVPGRYWLSVHLVQVPPGQIIDGADHVCPFELVDDGSVTARLGLPWRGKVQPGLAWTVVRQEGLSREAGP
jgi:hypothetical protein